MAIGKRVGLQILAAGVIFKLLGLRKRHELALVFAFVNTISKRGLVAQYISPFTLKFGEDAVSRVASLLLLLKPVRKEYSKLLQTDLDSTKKSIKENWKKFGPLITKIPEDGMSELELKQLVDKLSGGTEQAVIGEMYSGSIYSYSYMHPDFSSNKVSDDQKSETETVENAEEFLPLTRSLSRVYTYAFERSFLWNSLHEGEFGVGYWLNYQVIRMVAEQYGANPDEVMGSITTGGTDSLMSAIRLYGEWGKANKFLNVGEATIIACENIHAAVDKGCIAYGINLVKVPCNENGTISIPELKKAVKEHSDTLVALFASTPSYTLGLVDDVESVAAIAKEYGVGMHVDSCLGGFIITYLDNHKHRNFLAIPGVTSLSCDTHKNGWAPKGSSVLITKDIPDLTHPPHVNLSFYAAYAIPAWDGGVYGTPANPGSQHVTHVLHAYLAMLRIGKSGYRRIANKINSTVMDCCQLIKQETRLELLDGGDEKSLCNVFSFRVKPSLQWGVGSTYSLAHELAKRKVVVSALKGDRLHYCVTGRSAGNPKFLELFQEALNEAVEATALLAEQVKQGKIQFSGDAGLYGTLDAALEPTKENSKSTAEYISNLLLGKRVANDLVKTHFYALQDPFCANTV